MVTYLGSLVQLCCGEGGILQTNITGMCGECSQCLGHIGFAPPHGVCAFLVCTAQAPGCSAGELSKAGPVLHALPRSKPLRFRFLGTPTKAQTRLGQRFVPFPGPSSSGDQVLGEHTLPRCVCLIASPVPTAWFPGCAVGAPSQVCCVSLLGSRSLAVTLLVDVNRPGSQEDLLSNWESARSLVEDALSGAEIAPFRLWLPPACLPASGGGMGQSAAG